MNRFRCPRCHTKLGNFYYADACPHCRAELKHNTMVLVASPVRAADEKRSWPVRAFFEIVRLLET